MLNHHGYREQFEADIFMAEKTDEIMAVFLRVCLQQTRTQEVQRKGGGGGEVSEEQKGGGELWRKMKINTMLEGINHRLNTRTSHYT